MASESHRVSFRTQVLTRHLNPSSSSWAHLSSSPCLSFTPQELSEPAAVFDTADMRALVDGHNIGDRDWLFNLIIQSGNNLFNRKNRGHRSFVSPDYNQSMEQQRVMTMKRIEYLLARGVYTGWLTDNGPEAELRKLAFFETIAVYDHSLAIKLGVHFFLCYAMSFAGNYLKSVYVNRTPEMNKTIHIVSSALKATLTWHNMRTLQECREACGGQGLKTENRVGILKGEYDVQSTFEGDNNVLMQQVSKALFAEYIASHKRNKPFRGLWLEHMNEPSPVIPLQVSSSTLRCIKFQNDVFCLRERDLLNRFVEEVSMRQKQGHSKEYAFLLSYQLAEDLGRAFADKVILNTFLEVETKVPAGSMKDVLALLRSLYALVVLEEDASFLRYGYLSIEHAATVRQEVATLCSELRPHALGLVKSFGIPDALLGPIAFDWIDANSWSSVAQY